MGGDDGGGLLDVVGLWQYNILDFSHVYSDDMYEVSFSSKQFIKEFL